MLRFLRFLIAGVLCAATVAPSQSLRGATRHAPPETNPKPRQETGFLNRVITLQGVAYHFQVYLPESFRRDKHKPWPVILYLHGRGERGSEGMWQTQNGLSQAVRDHPERWQEASTLPAEYAHALGRTPVWLFHGGSDNIVNPRQSELLFEAFKASGGHVRLWIYQGLKHDCWTRAYNEPELPRWLLAHRTDPHSEPTVFAERLLIPLHPPAIKLTAAQLDALCGEYHAADGRSQITFFRQGELFFAKNLYGEVSELAAESPTVFFYPNGASLDRMTFERNAAGRVIAAVFRDDRHEERWEKRTFVSSR